jgi:hypothetical protein
MAKLTLLEIVQDILSDMNSDEVNSINDSVESLQVAQIVKSTYYSIIDGKDYQWLKELFKLNSSSNSNLPTHLYLPDTIVNVEWFRYNAKDSDDTRDNFKQVKYKTPQEFLEYTDKRDSSATNVRIINDPTGVEIMVMTDRAPDYFTSFDDNAIVCDAYNSEIENTLRSNKTKCFGQRNPSFTMSDNFIPDLPVQMFSYLLSEAKSISFNTLKQLPNPKAEQQAVSQRRRMSQEAWKVHNGISYPNYGRK